MINQTIAHYKITSKLGQGGMGDVYRATDTKSSHAVPFRNVFVYLRKHVPTGDAYNELTEL
jgi:serine/threonine protein kinase